ncbi:MAG TPA: hypothetical protein VFQ23_08595, partial [Anaerolineales bacterium]|nr:hypothetical protein [Anaerolineales bacterium]
QSARFTSMSRRVASSILCSQAESMPPQRHALGQAFKVILDTFAPGKWTINKTMRNFFNTIYRACVYTVDY